MDEWVLTRQQNHIGILLLNRPQALNAINDSLQQQILSVLEEWRDDQMIHAVLIMSNHSKAFCAGGDIRQIVEFVKKGNYEEALSIFQHNYYLAYYVAHYSKPIISLMNGITMGGGIGLAAFASYRIVTERSILAMPEVMIGLSPDAGSSLLFQKSPGFTGLRAMLTGQRLNGKEAIQMGFADYKVESSFIGNILKQLETENVSKVLKPFKQDYNFDSGFLEQICSVYNASSIQEIISRLKNSPYEWAQNDLKALLQACPLSLQITYYAWHQKLSNLKAVLKRDTRLINHLIRQEDFIEGVRSAVIDKDRSPSWSSSFISESEVDHYFVT